MALAVEADCFSVFLNMPQNKLTAPDEKFDVEGLKDLSPKQMAFVKGILDGMTASDAYRAAYNCENMLPSTVWASASRLRHDEKVAAWLSAARTANLGSAKVTLDGHVVELERLREIAIRSGNIGAAVQAEQLRGKAAGHYVDQVRDLTEHDPIATLDALAKLAPDLAIKLAQDNGISWQSETQH